MQFTRLRRTNDRSVQVISGDAEDASHVNGSYPSKRKYKLDLSSLHEDHEDDENAENGVLQRSRLSNLCDFEALINQRQIHLLIVISKHSVSTKAFRYLKDRCTHHFNPFRRIALSIFRIVRR